GAFKPKIEGYFAVSRVPCSGTYEKRYPRPNLTVWRRILAHVAPSSHLIDYGCGTGRYLLPLQPHIGRGAGFDISTEALETLKSRALVQGWQALEILGPDASDFDTYVARSGPADVVLCLFGVLGHITSRAARIAALTQIKTALKQGKGRLLISVPNAARRFRAEQREGVDGLIQYDRAIDGGDPIKLEYQLYTPDLLKNELSAAGFTVVYFGSESALPESLLLKYAFIRHFDAWLTRIIPSKWAYGLYAEAAW
ncbi:MAG: methyltransferase domain-containing protein, partial [Litoreibacter sp.]|nr:methyltransferase domain-containing protein [Litoreibacter sp.]